MTFDALTLADDQATEQRQMLDLVATVATLGDEISRLDKMREAAMAQLRQYLDLNGLDSLRDGERGITARLQDRKGTPVYDLVSLAKDTDGYALIEAASAGMARIDHVSLSRFRKDAGAGWADLIAKYELPGTGTTALLVERDKS